MLRLSAALGSALLLATAPAYGLSNNYSVTLIGSNEVPGPGVNDPDGFASGTITLDNSSATNNVTWSFTYSGLSTLTGFHIHGPGGPPGTNAGVLVSLGTLPGSGTLSGTTSTSIANVNAIFANPNDFYLNIHTDQFPNGAVRGQIPEPAPAQLIGLGAIALGWMRRQRRRKAH